MQSSAPSLELIDVGKRYGDTVAVHAMSLSLLKGEFFALLGASGCGKSTTLRMMAGLERPTSGRVDVNGVDVTRISAAQRDVALMFQSYALYPHLSVRENIAVPLRMRQLSAFGRLPCAALFSPAVRRENADIDAKTKRIAEMLGLGGLLGRKPGALSGGQQQRVALARALVRDPVAFLLDEPMSNLDAQLRGDTRAEIMALQQRTARTFVMVTHDQSDALSMADRVGVMIAGRLEQVAPPRQIYDRPASRAVAQFIGVKRMNIFEPGQLGHSLDDRGGSLQIGIRPEHLRQDAAGPLAGTIETVAFHGEETVIRLRSENGAAFVAALPGSVSLPSQGETMRLCAEPHRCHAFDPATGARVDREAVLS